MLSLNGRINLSFPLHLILTNVSGFFIDTPFDCENAAQIMLETIRAKASKIEISSSHCLTSKLENPEMLGIKNKS